MNPGRKEKLIVGMLLLLSIIISYIRPFAFKSDILDKAIICIF